MSTVSTQGTTLAVDGMKQVKPSHLIVLFLSSLISSLIVLLLGIELEAFVVDGI
jgi:hypothetical protein